MIPKRVRSMVSSKKRKSLRGALIIAGCTVAGTLACLAVSLAFTWYTSRHLSDEALRQGLFNATVLPIILAGPLFLYISGLTRQLIIANRRLAIIAATDSLTAVLNRGAFSARVDGWLAALGGDEAENTGALLVIDADHFKKINDEYGHMQGDEALKVIARAIQSAVRSRDWVGRLGGEEFGVFLPGASTRSAEEIAERVRTSVSSVAFSPKGKKVPLSVSVGCTTFVKPVDFSEVFRIADEQLYRAKSAGRNRVVSAHLRSGWASSVAPVLH